MSHAMLFDLLSATWETVYMVMVSGMLAFAIGLPIGVLLIITHARGLFARPVFYFGLAAVINALRSVPFIILLVAIIPFTRFIAGTSIGTTAAIVPLTLSAIPFMARVVESALNEVPAGLIETGLSMGASVLQIISRILLREALPGIIRGATLMLIALVGYAAMAGAIGGGGLGDFAIRYGYQRFDTKLMVVTVVILIIMVQIIQYVGDTLAQYLDHR